MDPPVFETLEPEQESAYFADPDSEKDCSNAMHFPTVNLPLTSNLKYDNKRSIY